ncbi:MAG TPA: Gfo/Idh/MocA family oxidoreductase, partial [Stellaceae bacterium]|nr:Gfo/Idh/MocA family oxidoreductase [Stellaceae bacterium]
DNVKSKSPVRPSSSEGNASDWIAARLCLAAGIGQWPGLALDPGGDEKPPSRDPAGEHTCSPSNGRPDRAGAFATFELAGGVLAQISSSWASRVKRDGLLQIQVDGVRGSAVCGLHRCFVQPLVTTPKPLFDPEHPQPMVFDEQWQEMPDIEPVRNGYRAGRELYLKHVAEDALFPSPLLEGAKSVQLAEACYQSNRERRWVDLPELNL